MTTEEELREECEWSNMLPLPPTAPAKPFELREVVAWTLAAAAGAALMVLIILWGGAVP